MLLCWQCAAANKGCVVLAAAFISSLASLLQHCFCLKTYSSKAKIRNFAKIALSERDRTDLLIVLVLLNCKGQWVERGCQEMLEAKLRIIFS